MTEMTDELDHVLGSDVRPFTNCDMSGSVFVVIFGYNGYSNCTIDCC